MAAINSAATMDIQMPSIPKISGNINTAATWKINVLRKEINAEMRPSFNAVKKDEPKIAIPEKRKEKEYIIKPRRVNSSRPWS